MGRKTRVLLVLLLAGILLACSITTQKQPEGMTQAEIQAAIDQTMAVRLALSVTATLPPPPTTAPTATPLPPTAIPDTPTTPPTDTPTVTATPDVRVILADPSQFQLKKDDLPWRGEYTIPGQDWSGPYTNDELIAAWDDPAMARQYLQESGRITGYETYFKLGNPASGLPKEVGCSLVQFNTAEGARMAITDYSFTNRDTGEGWVTVGVTLPLGDVNIAEYLEKMDEGGAMVYEYWVETAYRNMLVECVAWGTRTTVTPAFVEEITQKVLAKVQAAELSQPSQILQGGTPAP